MTDRGLIMAHETGASRYCILHDEIDNLRFRDKEKPFVVAKFSPVGHGGTMHIGRYATQAAARRAMRRAEIAGS